MFDILNNEAVRFTVKTHGLESGTVTFPEFNGKLTNQAGLIDTVQFVDAYGNHMAKTTQILKEIQKIEVFHQEWVPLLEIKDVEFNHDLAGFVVSIQNDRIIEVQFELITDQSNENCGSFMATVNKKADYGYVNALKPYGYDLSDSESVLFSDWLECSDEILNYIDTLNIQHSK